MNATSLPSTHSRLTWRGRAVLVLALAVHLSLWLSLHSGCWNGYTFDSTATAGLRGWDFFALYQAGHNVLHGDSAYESDNERIEVAAPRYTPYRYLPLPAYTLGAALSLLSPLWALRLWLAVSEAVLLLCARAAWRLGRRGDRGALLAAMWLAYTPYYLELYLGQFNTVQAALILALLLALAPADAPSGAARTCQGRRRQSWRRDLAWAASLLWKQNTALFAPLWLRLRQWRTLAWGAGAVLLTSLPYFWAVPGSWAAFAGNFQAGAPAANLGNLGLRQWLFSALSALWPGLSPRGHAALQTVWVAVVIAAGLALTWRAGGQGAKPLDVSTGSASAGRRAPLEVLCLWTASFFLIYHQVWEHHYLLLLPALTVLCARERAALPWVVYILLAIWTPYRLVDPAGLAAIHAPLRWTPLSPPLLDVLYHGSKALPALALWTWLAWRLWRRPAPPAVAEEPRP